MDDSFELLEDKVRRAAELVRKLREQMADSERSSIQP